MAIMKFEERKVGDDFVHEKSEGVMAFENYKEMYRMCCEFEHIGGLDFKVVKNTPVIFGHSHRVAIYPLDKDRCQAHIVASINFEKKFKESNVEYILHEEELNDGSFNKVGQWGQCGEFTLDFKMEDLSKVGNIFKFKKASKSAINPYSLRNLHEYLRFARNIHPMYGEILEQRLAENREEGSSLNQLNFDL
jgi:hypothetical protein